MGTWLALCDISQENWLATLIVFSEISFTIGAIILTATLVKEDDMRSDK
jgi:hypothetical protein